MRSPLLFIFGWYAWFCALAIALQFAIGWGWAMAVAVIVLTAALAIYVRHAGLEPGESFCFVIRRKYRVRHIHFPRSGYTTCERVREMFEEDHDQPC